MPPSTTAQIRRLRRFGFRVRAIAKETNRTEAEVWAVLRAKRTEKREYVLALRAEGCDEGVIRACFGRE